MRQTKADGVKKKPRSDTSAKAKRAVRKKKAVKKILVERTRNAGTWTEAQFFQSIRSALRQKSRFWKPRTKCLEDHRRPNESSNRRLKWEFNCDHCKSWFPQTQVEVHHKVPAGSLNSYDDLAGFVSRLFAEDGWQCLCKECHAAVHAKKE